jgi:hypothetical protein
MTHRLNILQKSFSTVERYLYIIKIVYMLSKARRQYLAIKVTRTYGEGSKSSTSMFFTNLLAYLTF